MLKLYIYDGGWPGAVVILAESAEEALSLYKTESNYLYFSAEDLTETEISVKGIVLEAMGDR